MIRPSKGSILVGCGALIGWGLAGWALPSGEVVAGGGMVSYGYQVGGLGEFDKSGHHLDVDVGVTESLGVGLSLSRMSGRDRDTRRDIDITVGSVYGKFQLLEAEERPGALAGYLGYHWSSERDETLSGVGLGLMASAFTSSGVNVHGRLGMGTRPGDDVIEFEVGVAWRPRPELEALVGLRTFSAGGENEGGLVVGLSYRFSAGRERGRGESW